MDQDESDSMSRPALRAVEDTPETSEKIGPRLAFSRSQRRQELREADDRKLLAALAQDDDEDALDEIIRRKTEALVQASWRVLGDLEEARDVVQMSFLKMWENRTRYNPKWSPNTWIYRIVTNLSIDLLRSRRSKERHLEPLKLHMEDVASSKTRRNLAAMHEDEVLRIFHQLAGDLTEKQRTVFLLREVEGISSKEVAEIVGCRESTVRNHLFNARKILQRELLRLYPEYARAYAKTEGGEK